jgi:glycosyltransferase involved in cell wall biosynthesis
LPNGTPASFRLCVDGGPTEYGHRLRGIGSVTRALLTTLTPALARRHGAELCHIRRRPDPSIPSRWARRSWAAELSGAAALVPQRIANWWQALDTAITLPRDVAAQRPDVFLATDPHGVACAPAFATVAMLYDLVPLVFPEYFAGLRGRAKSWLYHQRLVQMRKADAWIAISQATKDDAIRFGRFDPDAITVVPLAVDRASFPAIDPAVARGRVAERFGVTRPYFLFVGASEPRKNLDGLMAAYRQIAAACPVDLVVAGPTTLGNAGAAAEGERVHWTGHVSTSELADLYAGAYAFVFPTLYEGFGLPILEAMSAGTPVITSPISSVPEVAGDAALYADPRDAAALAGAMRRVFEDETLRTDLRARGFERVDQFTWTRTTEAILDVCRAVAERRTARAAGA